MLAIPWKFYGNWEMLGNFRLRLYSGITWGEENGWRMSQFVLTPTPNIELVDEYTWNIK